jgi:glycosyltransferase involved in cell wall biosynthesis
MKKVSILVPCYNEEQSLPLLYDALSNEMDQLIDYDWELLFVNDGSKDNTMTILASMREKDKRVNYLDLSRNFGKENAMLAGFDYVTGDCMILMDADLQDPPSLIPELLKEWENGFQDVYARRRDRGKESWLRKKFSILFYRILDHSTRFDILQNVGDFRLLDRQCIDALCQMRETERYTKGMFCWIGFNKKEVVFDRGDRKVGDSKWNFKSLFNLAIEGITSFTTAPLRFSTIIGFVIALCAFMAGLFYLVKTIVFGDQVRGFTTLIVFISFFGGLQLMAIGILGEYLGRIFNEVKGRPVYLVNTYNGEQVKNGSHKG